MFFPLISSRGRKRRTPFSDSRPRHADPGCHYNNADKFPFLSFHPSSSITFHPLSLWTGRRKVVITPVDLPVLDFKYFEGLYKSYMEWNGQVSGEPTALFPSSKHTFVRRVNKTNCEFCYCSLPLGLCYTRWHKEFERVDFRFCWIYFHFMHPPSASVGEGCTVFGVLISVSHSALTHLSKARFYTRALARVVASVDTSPRSPLWCKATPFTGQRSPQACAV